MLAISANAINASLYGKLNFNFIRDIAPVASISTIPLVMEVNPAVPAHTVPKFIAYAKANPCKINMASGGTGSPLHVAGELFKMMAGVDMIHVPDRSEALALPDLISGQLQIMFGVMPWPIRPHISEGRRRCPRPNECRSARCGRRSSPTAATLHERRLAGKRVWIVGGSTSEHADAAHPLALLRAGREWQYCRRRTPMLRLEDSRYGVPVPRTEVRWGVIHVISSAKAA
jgi:hypothetical protein